MHVQVKLHGQVVPNTLECAAQATKTQHNFAGQGLPLKCSETSLHFETCANSFCNSSDKTKRKIPFQI
eukprot:6379391-Amphidinium_carterae.1